MTSTGLLTTQTLANTQSHISGWTYKHYTSSTLIYNTLPYYSINITYKHTKTAKWDIFHYDACKVKVANWPKALRESPL
jgi:hypothetical protein